MTVRYGTAPAGELPPMLEGKDLTKFMGNLNEYLGTFEKADKRFRNDKVTSAGCRVVLARGEGPRAPR